MAGLPHKLVLVPFTGGVVKFPKSIVDCCTVVETVADVVVIMVLLACVVAPLA